MKQNKMIEKKNQICREEENGTTTKFWKRKIVTGKASLQSTISSLNAQVPLKKKGGT
jgi:hypothetical protein